MSFWNDAAVGVLLTLILVGERLIEALQPVVKPVLLWVEKVAHLPVGYAGMVFSWVSLAAVVGLSGINVFPSMVPATYGRILTALLAGGGSTLLHDLWPGTTKATT